MAYVYKFIPKSFFGVPDEGVMSFARQTLDMWKSVADVNDHHARIIIHNSRYSLDSYVQSLNIAKAHSGDTNWKIQGLVSLINVLKQKAQEYLFQPYVYLVLFDKKVEDANEAALLFQSQTGMLMIGNPQTGATLPRIIPNVAMNRENHIFVPPNKYWKFQYITDFVGEHDLYHPMYGLVMNRFETVISFDIRSYSTARLGNMLDLKNNQLRAAMNGNGNVLSREKLERRFQTLQMIRGAINSRSESLHEITGAIGFAADTMEQMKDHQNAVSSTVNGYYTLAAPPGVQKDILEMFTTKQPWGINYPGNIKRNVTTGAIAMGNMVGNGFPEPGGSEGIWYGNSLLNGHPILYDGFGAGKNEANHSIIVGMTGSGKTVFLQTMAYRHLLNDVQVIVLEPKGHFRRIHSAVDDSAYNDMDFAKQYSLNIFDWVYEDLNDQVGHVINALSLLLRKAFNEAELAVLRSEITNLYKKHDVILLSNVVYGLKSKKWQDHENEIFRNAASNLADIITISILDTDLNSVFNRQTRRLNLNLDNVSLAVYDFEKVSSEYKGLLYYLILANIHNYCIQHKRQRNRIIIVDEYYLMSQIPALAESLSLFFKTFRTYGVAVWVAEQDWFTLTGVGSEGNKHGQYLISNASNIVVLHHSSQKNARDLQVFFPELSDELLSYVTGQPVIPGRGIVKLKDRIMPFQLELTPSEQKLFVGS